MKLGDLRSEYHGGPFYFEENEEIGAIYDPQFKSMHLPVDQENFDQLKSLDNEDMTGKDLRDWFSQLPDFTQERVEHEFRHVDFDSNNTVQGIFLIKAETIILSEVLAQTPVEHNYGESGNEEIDMLEKGIKIREQLIRDLTIGSQASMELLADMFAGEGEKVLHTLKMRKSKLENSSNIDTPNKKRLEAYQYFLEFVEASNLENARKVTFDVIEKALNLKLFPYPINYFSPERAERMASMADSRLLDIFEAYQKQLVQIREKHGELPSTVEFDYKYGGEYQSPLYFLENPGEYVAHLDNYLVHEEFQDAVQEAAVTSLQSRDPAFFYFYTSSESKILPISQYPIDTLAETVPRDIILQVALRKENKNKSLHSCIREIAELVEEQPEFLLETKIEDYRNVLSF